MTTANMSNETRPVPEAAESARVLIADDDPVSRSVLERDLIANGFQVQSVADGVQALAVAEQPDAPRLIILDWVMPGMSGPEICARLRLRKSEDQCRYVLLLSAKGRINDVVTGLDAGADDYLIKPFQSSELLARIRVGTRTLKLQDDLLRAHELLRFQATHDSLTGIWNRGALMQLAQSEIQRAQRTSAAIGFLLIDLDYFKNINDRLGHPTGDLVLREVAQQLSQAVRAYDVVGRYGGEEFLVVAAALGQRQLHEYADRLRSSIAALRIETPGGSASVTISIGVSAVGDATECALESMIRRADVALYQAKRQGRNRIVLDSLVPAYEIR